MAGFKYSVAVGNIKISNPKSCEAVRFISKLAGFYGLHPCYPKGTLCMFDDINSAKRAKNKMEAEGIKCGKNICKFKLSDDGNTLKFVEKAVE